jgi:EAL domain-containing protein (putative c-di-GMP-specific phosphodiesterase class I)
MSVNLSARQLRDASFLKHYDEFFLDAPCRPNSLALEITETALIENSESVGPVLAHLNARGAILSLDDFGTGFSSLSYIVKLPIGQIKVDRSFVSKVCEGGREAIVTRIILQLGEALGLPVTAEGVETQEQLEWLRANNCARAQGYLFSRPIDAKAATQLLQEKQNW